MSQSVNKVFTGAFFWTDGKKIERCEWQDMTTVYEINYVISKYLGCEEKNVWLVSQPAPHCYTKEAWQTWKIPEDTIYSKIFRSEVDRMVKTYLAVETEGKIRYYHAWGERFKEEPSPVTLEENPGNTLLSPDVRIKAVNSAPLPVVPEEGSELYDPGSPRVRSPGPEPSG